MPQGAHLTLEPTGDLSQASDEELVRLVCLGKRDLFAHLVGRYQRSIYHIVQGILENSADSEEVLQESFLKALQHIEDFRGEAKFRTWLTRIAINEARMRLRKYRTKLHDSIDEPADDMMDMRPRELRDWQPNPEEKLAEAELARLLEKAIRGLPGIYREVLLLRDVEHLSNEETAQALGISLSATKARLLRARLMMRDYIAPHFEKSWHHRLLDRFTQRGRPV
jgi:RNA polymerase sigma-70 factor, ECF subfamily